MSEKIQASVPRGFKNVQLIQLSAESQINFDLFLRFPMNKRDVHYVHAGEMLGPTRAAALQNHQFQTMIPADQLERFYQFSAGQLRALKENNTLNEKEKSARLLKATRDLLTSIYSDNGQDDFDRGREMLSDCEEIVKVYILEDLNSTNWHEYARTAAKTTEDDVYNQAVVTSTYAALLSIALNIGKPADLATAGLLHNVGMLKIPEKVIRKLPLERTASEQALYEQHPLISTQLLREKNMPVSKKVQTIIEQHHERFDGKGYPAQLSGEQILAEAQLLAAADRMAEITVMLAGQPDQMILDTIELLCNLELRNPNEAAINPEILLLVKKMFLPEKYFEVSKQVV